MSDEDRLPPITIVISYRRKDTPGGVARLRESLVPQFGRENVFLDIDTLRPGVNWRKTIPETISTADVFLPVIGHHWLDATDDRGRRRLDLPNDVLRFEVATALKAGIPIIPVQLHGAPMPDAEELPDEIAELTDFMSIRIEDDDWVDDVQKLIRALTEIQEKVTETARTQEERRAEEEHHRAEEAALLRAEEERQRAEKERARADEAAPAAEAERQRTVGAEGSRLGETEESRFGALHERRRVREPTRAAKPAITRRRMAIGIGGAAVVALAVVVSVAIWPESKSATDLEEPTTTPSERPFPTAAESTLLRHVPRRIRKDCDRHEYVGLGDPENPAPDASVICTRVGGVSLVYTHFRSARGMRLAYDASIRVASGASIQGGTRGTCGLTPSSGGWTRVGPTKKSPKDSGMAGAYSCVTYSVDPPGPDAEASQADLHWTDRELNIYTEASPWAVKDGPKLGKAWRDGLFGPEL